MQLCLYTLTFKYSLTLSHSLSLSEESWKSEEVRPEGDRGGQQTPQALSFLSGQITSGICSHFLRWVLVTRLFRLVTTGFFRVS